MGEIRSKRPAQRRNTASIRVSFPADWPDEPSLAGQTLTLYFPTEEAALLTAAGFRMRGATA
jgi:hypothetical protein